MSTHTDIHQGAGRRLLALLALEERGVAARSSWIWSLRRLTTTSYSDNSSTSLVGQFTI